MTSTSGILGALGLAILFVVAFQWGAQKTHADHVDVPTDHIIYELPVNN